LRKPFAIYTTLYKKLGHVGMGVGSGGPWPSLILKHGTDMVDRGLIVPFSVFLPLPTHGNFFLPTLLHVRVRLHPKFFNSGIKRNY